MMSEHENLVVAEQSSPNDSIVEDLEKGLKQVYKREPMSKERYMILYHETYHYCTRTDSKSDEHPEKCLPAKVALHEQIIKLLEDHLQIIREQTDSLNGEDLLQKYIKLWEEYRFSSKVFNGICSYLNRQWEKQEKQDGSKGIFEVYQLAMFMWKNHVFKSLDEKTTKVILKLIEGSRNKEPINTSIISGILHCYVELGLDENDLYSKHSCLKIYKTSFEDTFLQETKAFYARESADFLQHNSVTEYLKKAEERLQEEEKLCQICLHQSTKTSLIKTCEETLIQNHIPILTNEFLTLKDENKIDDLARMYQLLSRVPNGLNELAVKLEDYIKNNGISSLSKFLDPALMDPKLFIETILDVHRKYKNLIVKAFKSDINFFAALDKACVAFINTNSVTKTEKISGKSAELLAKYCDLLLKKSAKNLEEEELENALNQIMQVLTYIEDKDMFESYYSKMLAERLLNRTSASDDAEVSMITKLKQNCGFGYTSGFQRMFQDIEVSKDLNQKFKKYLKSSSTPLNIDFSIQVLTSVVWPLEQSFDFSLPSELENPVKIFTDFFFSQHCGKKLNWLHKNSSGEMITNCFKKKYTFQTSIFQMGVLLQFNSSLSYTLLQLQEATQLKMDYLTQVIQIFLKAKLLVSETKEEELSPSSVVELFTDYKNKKLKVNINVPIKIEQKVEREATEKNVEEGRKIMVQTTIVRIMKTRKTLEHQQLLLEVMDQLSTKFKPSPFLIKKCIGILIEKEYLERQEGKKNTYNYVA